MNHKTEIMFWSDETLLDELKFVKHYNILDLVKLYEDEFEERKISRRNQKIQNILDDDKN